MLHLVRSSKLCHADSYYNHHNYVTPDTSWYFGMNYPPLYPLAVFVVIDKILMHVTFDQKFPSLLYRYLL